MRISWVSSGGGPLVVIPERLLGSWAGADDEDGEVTDYDRASEVEEYAGFIEVDGVRILVLDDDPAPTTYLDDKKVFVRRLAADNDAAVLAALDESLSEADWQEVGTWEVDGPLVLFDAAYAGSDLEISGSLRVNVAPGSYVVRSAYVKPNPETWLVLVTLRRWDA